MHACFGLKYGAWVLDIRRNVITDKLACVCIDILYSTLRRCIN